MSERQLRRQGLVRFDFLAGALPGRAAPTDIDLMLEHNGHFLFLEGKRPGQSMPNGQRLALERLLALSTPTHSVHVLVIVGHPPDEIVGATWWGGPVQTPLSCEGVRKLVRLWWEWAERQ
jgi:hypothetical protein